MNSLQEFIQSLATSFGDQYGEYVKTFPEAKGSPAPSLTSKHYIQLYWSMPALREERKPPNFAILRGMIYASLPFQ